MGKSKSKSKSKAKTTRSELLSGGVGVTMMPMVDDAKGRGVGEDDEKEEEEGCVLRCLIEAFSSAFSLDDILSAYTDADGEANNAASILYSAAAASSSTTTISADCSLVLHDFNNNNKRRTNKKEKKKTSISTGTVSTILSKNYTSRNTPITHLPSTNSSNLRPPTPPPLPLPPVWKVHRPNPTTPITISYQKNVSTEDVEGFLCSMLGDECELNLGVIRDVLCQYDYDVEQSLDALLDLTSVSLASLNHGGHMRGTYLIKEDGNTSSHGRLHQTSEPGCLKNWQFTDDCLYSSRSDDSLQLSGSDCNDSEESCSSDMEFLCDDRSKTDLGRKVLEALFRVPESSEKEPKSMNWKMVVKQMESLGQDLQLPSTYDVPLNLTFDVQDEYQLHRADAKQQWDCMRSYFRRAAAAYMQGQQAHAAYLSDQGKTCRKMAQLADEKASRQIFLSRNRKIQNEVTIDLHGQHVKPALRLVKLHLILFTYVRSVNSLRVITGSGVHGMGESKIKQSVIALLEKEGIQWVEVNAGTLLVKLDDIRELSFVNSDAETDD